MHRTAGATEVVISSAKRFAILHELRGEPEWDLPDLLGKLAPVDLVLVEGFKRDAFPKLEIHRAANGKPLLQPDDPHIVAIASDTPLPQAEGAGGRPQRHRADRRCAAQARRAAAIAAAAHAEGVMAQLTDDCFAFSGPLLPIADMERMIAERVQPVTETESVPLAAARGRVLAGDIDRAARSAAVRQFRGRWLRGAAPRSRRQGRNQARDRRPPDRRQRRGAADRRGPGDPHLHRRADAGRRRHRVHAGGRARRRRRGHRAGRASSPAPTAGSPARTCARARSCCRPGGGSPCRTSRSPPRSA